jgi:hypothetical protein
VVARMRMGMARVEADTEAEEPVRVQSIARDHTREGEAEATWGMVTRPGDRGTGLTFLSAPSISRCWRGAAPVASSAGKPPSIAAILAFIVFSAGRHFLL